jgi:group I intron endonuclease
MTCAVYRITCTETGETYVGQSYALEERWADHRRNLRKDRHANQTLQNLWNAYGEDAFTFEIIEKCDRDDVQAREKEIIRRERPALNPMQVDAASGKWLFPNRVARGPWSRTPYTGQRKRGGK